MMAFLAKAKGQSRFVEIIFDRRYGAAEPLKQMGADILVNGSVAIINGVKQLVGTSVEATDIRCAAALVIAALSAKGETRLSGLHHIDRGYVSLVDRLKALDMDLVRV
jgi:UDP-N-acetylglucosamine 1-carboxyvinyltransferase